MLIEFNIAFNLLCLAAIERFLPINPTSSNFSISLLFFNLPPFTSLSNLSTKRDSGIPKFRNRLGRYDHASDIASAI
jgi:hypothetical protein